MAWEINFTLEPSSSTSGEAVARNLVNGFTRRAFVDTSNPVSISVFVESCQKGAEISAEREKIEESAKQSIVSAFAKISD